MVLKISAIQDAKLKSIANDVDSKYLKNGNVDKDEISELFIHMVNKGYEYEDFTSLLGAEFDSIANEEKLHIYEDCYSGLNQKFFKDKKRLRALQRKCNKKNERAIIGLSSILGAIMTFKNSETLSLIAKSSLKGGIVGALVGSIIGIGLKVFNNKSLENAQESHDNKKKALDEIHENIENLKSA